MCPDSVTYHSVVLGDQIWKDSTELREWVDEEVLWKKYLFGVSIISSQLKNNIE